ncbi:MAG: DUF4115 domain-containing protein, partial [Cyanobacteria bacterium P01_G01_bin.49]
KTTADNNSSQTVKRTEEQPQKLPQPVTKTDSTPTEDKFIASEKPAPILEPSSESTVEEPNSATPSPTLSEPPQEPTARTETRETPQTETSEANTQTEPVKAAIKLENDSWLNIKVDGQTEYEGFLKAGSQQAWTAKKSLVIRAGNAGAVNLSINDKPAQSLGESGQVKEITITPDS